MWIYTSTPHTPSWRSAYLTRFTCGSFVSINDMFSRLGDQSKRFYVGLARFSQSATSFYKHLELSLLVS
jgi:hypothetical protein